MEMKKGRKIRAISVKEPYASLIAEGKKTIETRKWGTKYRGEVLFVSSKRPKVDGKPTGMALAIADIVDCKPMTEADQEAACCEIYDNAQSWGLKNIRRIKTPFPVKGQLKFFTVVLPKKVKLEAVI